MRWYGRTLRDGEREILEVKAIGPDMYELLLGDRYARVRFTSYFTAKAVAGLAKAWTYAMTGQECPEEGAPWARGERNVSAVKWSAGLYLEHDEVPIGALSKHHTGWTVELMQEREQSVVVRGIALPVAMQLLNGWCVARTGQQLPEEGAPWLS